MSHINLHGSVLQTRMQQLELVLAPLEFTVLHIRESRAHNPQFQNELDELNENTIGQIIDAGHNASLIPCNDLSIEQMLQIVDASDAVLIMGGEDVEPSLYAGSLSYPGAGHHEVASDRNQIAAIQHAITTKTPLLGICRGLQLINVALGGTLIQHLDNADAHRGTGNDPFMDTRFDSITAELAEDLSAKESHKCTHHQAIHELGEGLQIAAMSTDDIIEAIVHESAPVTGVQWHPEHPLTASTQLRTLINRLQGQCTQISGSVSELING